MASGCILGDCYLCEDTVFEDEAVWVDQKGSFRHDRCKTDMHLKKENADLRKIIAEYKKWYGDIHVEELHQERMKRNGKSDL